MPRLPMPILFTELPRRYPFSAVRKYRQYRQRASAIQNKYCPMIYAAVGVAPIGEHMGG
jgi:hypothetical protein